MRQAVSATGFTFFYLSLTLRQISQNVVGENVQPSLTFADKILAYFSFTYLLGPME
jgi:hypothetical protein